MSSKILLFETNKYAFFIFEYDEKFSYEFLDYAMKLQIIPREFFPFNLYNIAEDFETFYKMHETKKEKVFTHFLFIMEKKQYELLDIKEIQTFNDESVKRVMKIRKNLNLYNKLKNKFKNKILFEGNIDPQLSQILKDNLDKINSFGTTIKYKTFPINPKKLPKDSPTINLDDDVGTSEKDFLEDIKNPFVYLPALSWVFLKYFYNRYSITPVRSPVHFENLFIGLPHNTQRIQILDENGDPLMLRLSYTEQKAIFSFQKILKRRSYKGDYSLEIDREGLLSETQGTSIVITKNFPVLSIDMNEFYKEYGISSKNKNKTSGRIYNEAKKAIDSLAKKRFKLKYTEKVFDPKTKKYHYREIIFPDFQLIYRIEMEEGIEEDGKRTKQKKKQTILLSELFIEEIFTYAILFPEHLFSLIDKSFKMGKEQALYLLKYIFSVAHQSAMYNKNYEINEDLKRIAKRIGLESYVKKREFSKLKKSISSKLEKFKELEFVENYDVTSNKVYIKLNQKKFEQIYNKNSIKK